MIDSVLISVQRNSDDVGLALNPQDAYTLEKEGKLRFILMLKMDILLAMICQMLKSTTTKVYVTLPLYIHRIMI